MVNDFTRQESLYNCFIDKWLISNYIASVIIILRGCPMEINVLESRPAGYAYLLDKLGLTGMPHWHTSFVSSSGTLRSKVQDGAIEDIYPTRYWPGERVGDHLEFALKYDGVNLGLLARIFEHTSQKDLAEYINSKPTGKYARRIWFFYEFLTGKQLPVDNISSGNYVVRRRGKGQSNAKMGLSCCSNH